MSKANINAVRVLRYAPDGGYAAIEWLRAFQSVEIPRTISDADTYRIGVQITKKRVIDVILHIETFPTLRDRLRQRLARTRTHGLYRSRKRCARTISGAGRPLALLSARHAGTPVQILVCAATD